MSGHKHHEHGGKTSEGLLDPTGILLRIGLQPGEVLIDAGCGSGHFSLAASKLLGSRGRVYAVDLHREGLQALEEKVLTAGLENITIIRADITESIPVPSDCCDVYLMVNVFHGLVANGELDASVQVMRGLLKEYGRVVIIDFKKMESSPGPPEHIRLSRIETLEIFKVLGYEKIASFWIRDFHYGLVVRKSRN